MVLVHEPLVLNDFMASDPIFIRIPPPGPLVQQIRKSTSISRGSSVPTDNRLLLSAALSVRFSVFVHEQRCSAENEVDADDARSWHWVAFATPKDHLSKSVNGSLEMMEIENRNYGTREATGDGIVAAAAIRLVPVSSPVASLDGDGSHKEQVEGPRHGPTTMWDGQEPYIKLGRLATLTSHRGLSLGSRLVAMALEWADTHREILRRTEVVDEEKREGTGDGWDGLILVHAQKGVQGFWTKVGFCKDEGMGEWWEEGIKHVGMWKRL